MKKFILFIVMSVVVISVSGQSEKYMQAMQEKVALLDSTQTPADLKDLSAAFERIAEAEKEQWLPYYYAAYTQVMSAYMMMNEQSSGLAETFDPIADKAEQLLNKAEELSKDNSEIYIIKKMIASLRMMADPMNRYMQYGPAAQQALETAKKLNPENPRVYLLEGQDKFYTPEQYGGSKDEAKKLFEEALEKFESFKPASTIDPSWGKNVAEYFLSQTK